MLTLPRTTHTQTITATQAELDRLEVVLGVTIHTKIPREPHYGETQRFTCLVSWVGRYEPWRPS